MKNVDYGSLITIGARPAMGITDLLFLIFHNLLNKKHKCLFFSPRMNSQEVVERLIILETWIDCQKRRSKNFSPEDIDKIKQSIEKLSKSDIAIFDNIVDVSQIQKEINNYDVEYVFVDSVHLIYGFEKSSDNIVSDVFTKLKQSAQAHNCILFITCNLLDDIDDREDKHPTLHDLRKVGGGDIASDAVLFLYRDCYYNLLENTHPDYYIHKYKAEIQVAKNICGATGFFELIYDSNRSRFLNWQSDYCKNCAGVKFEDKHDLS